MKRYIKSNTDRIYKLPTYFLREFDYDNSKEITKQITEQEASKLVGGKNHLDKIVNDAKDAFQNSNITNYSYMLDDTYERSLDIEF